MVQKNFCDECEEELGSVIFEATIHIKRIEKDPLGGSSYRIISSDTKEFCGLECAGCFIASYKLGKIEEK